ncbi:MAG: hypothetical protein KKF56_02305 [Nanoarchaeota archaeon]|nr:hypothetical protein [Nanoarchaeota archaeon]
MEEETERKNWHDKYYKLMLLIPLVLLLFSFYSIYSFYNETGDFFKKDVSLTGGTSITVNSEVDHSDLQSFLEGKIGDFSIRGISDLRTGEELAFIVETISEPEVIQPVLEEYLGYELTQENSSIEFTGQSLSVGFYKQLQIAILIALILMSIVVFIIFRNFIPSLAVIVSVIADIAMTLVVVNMLGMKISNAGIVALLMLIGYSVDSDILLTTRSLKSNVGTVNSRLFGAFKTGITMTLTSMAAVGVALYITSSFSSSLNQIFTIILIGLGFDLFNTWITNIGILKWYMEKKKID